jgi:hypothetical protein
MAVQKDCIKGPHPALSKGEGKENNILDILHCISSVPIEHEELHKILIYYFTISVPGSISLKLPSSSKGIEFPISFSSLKTSLLTTR